MVTSEESNSSPLRADGRVRQLAPQPGQGRLAGCHGDSQADQVQQFFWGPGQDQLRVPQTHHHPHPHLNLQDQPLCKGQASEGHSLPLAFLTLSYRALTSGQNNHPNWAGHLYSSCGVGGLT